MTANVIDVQHVSRNFGHTRALQNITWQVAPGSVVGLLGRNGAGKTTLLQTLVGLLRTDSGTANILGEPSRTLSSAAKARLGYVAQQPLLPDWPKVAQLCDHWSAFYPRWDRALVENLIDRFQLPRVAKVKTLSVGQKQSLALVLALGPLPDLLILDEPAASLDPVARRAFLDALIDVAIDGQRSIVLSTHLTTDIERVADRVTLLRGGQIAWDGELDILKSSVKRLRLTGGQLRQRPQWPEIRTWRYEEQTALTVVQGDIDEISLRLHAQLGTAVTVEHLSLEDIVVELHQ